MRRMGLWLAVIAAGSVLILIGCALGWSTERIALVGDTGPMRDVTRTGSDLAPGAVAAAWAALAGLLAIIATRGVLRAVVGGLIAAAGIAGLASIVGRTAPGALLALAGSALLVAAGIATVVLARRWPALGRRYDAPDAARPSTSPWDALDRGVDPTDETPRRPDAGPPAEIPPA